MNNNEVSALTNYETENEKMPKGKLRISQKCIINITTIGLAITIGVTGLVHVVKRSTNEMASCESTSISGSVPDG